MAVLTWRNVDAPQGGGAIQGLALGAGLLSKGTEGLADSLGKFGQAQTDLANNAAAQAAARFQTAGGLSSALGDGSLVSGLQQYGVDPSRVDAATMASLQKGVGDRISNDLHSQQISTEAAKAQYDLSRAGKTSFEHAVALQNQTGMDGIRQTQNEIQRLRSLNRMQEADALANSPAYLQQRAAVDPKELAALDQAGLTAGNTRLSGQTSLYDLTTKMTDRQNTELATSSALNALAGPVTNDQGMYKRVRDMQLPPMVEAQVIQQINATKRFNINPGPLGSDVVGGFGSSTPSAVYSGPNNPMRFTLGFGQVDPSINTVGDVVDNGRALADAHKTKDGVGHSNVGPYQITAPTWSEFAPKALGTNWRSADINDYTTHDKVASAIWDTVKDKPSAMIGRWESITPAQAEALKGADWNTAREVIAKGESKVSPAALLAGAARPAGAAVPAEVAGIAAPQNNAVPTLAAMTQAAQDDSYLNTLGAAGTQQRRGQQTAILGVPTKAYLDASGSDIASNNAAVDLLTGSKPKDGDPTGIAGALQGKDKNVVGRMLEQIVQSPEGMRKDKDGNLVPISYGQAALILAKGNNVLQPSHHPLAEKWDPRTLSFDDSGQVFNKDAAMNLLKSLSTNDVAAGAGKQVRLDQADAQVKDAMTNVQNVQTKIKSLIAVAAQHKDVDPTLTSQLMGEFERAKARLAAAQAKQNDEASQPLGVTDAQVRKEQEKKAAQVKQVDAAKATALLRELAMNPMGMGM